MKIIGVFLLIISSSIADDLCEEMWDGDCEPAGPACGNHEVVAVGAGLCPVGQKCCAHVCEEKWDGKCRAGCGGGDIRVLQPGLCPVLEKCCVDKDDTACDKQMGGKCKNACGGNDVPVGEKHPTRDCLCPLNKKCCVEDNDRCEDVKGGKCRTSIECQKRGGKETVPNVCTIAGDICCVPDPPCERKPPPKDDTVAPMGICIETDHCPEGYQSAEHRCIHKPAGVNQWCYDDDELCCVPDPYP